MKNVIKTALTTLAVMALPLSSLAALKDDTMAPLDALAKAAEAETVSANINGSNIGAAMTIGDQIQFHIDVTQDAYISIVYVDSQGVIDIIDPSFGDGGNFLAAGQSAIYPAEGSDVTLTLEPPLGRDAVYVFATANQLDAAAYMPQITRNQNPATVTSAETQLFEMEDSVKVAQAFAAAVQAVNTPADYAVALMESTVQGRAGAEYSSEDIVAFFSARKYRSISKPKLDANILFHTNSADLTDQAKINLDEWGKSLVHPTLSGSTFQIGGHTDDTGASDYNKQLSEQRAEAVRTYLAAKFEIDAERLETMAYGEEAPLVDGTDDEARRQNRRVEFRRLSAN